MKTIKGKIVLRTVLVTAVVVVILAVATILSVRSLASNANDQLAEAREWLPETAIGPMESLVNDIGGTSSSVTTLLIFAGILGIAAAGGLALMMANSVVEPIVKLRRAATASARALEGAADSDDLPQLPGVVIESGDEIEDLSRSCLLYTSPSPRDATLSRMPSSA